MTIEIELAQNQVAGMLGLWDDIKDGAADALPAVATAAGTAGGTVVGAAVGTVLEPGGGSALGGAVGAWVGSKAGGAVGDYAKGALHSSVDVGGGDAPGAGPGASVQDAINRVAAAIALKNASSGYTLRAVGKQWVPFLNGNRYPLEPGSHWEFRAGHFHYWKPGIRGQHLVDGKSVIRPIIPNAVWWEWRDDPKGFRHIHSWTAAGQHSVDGKSVIPYVPFGATKVEWRGSGPGGRYQFWSWMGDGRVLVDGREVSREQQAASAARLGPSKGGGGAALAVGALGLAAAGGGAWWWLRGRKGRLWGAPCSRSVTCIR